MGVPVRRKRFRKTGKADNIVKVKLKGGGLSGRHRQAKG